MLVGTFFLATVPEFVGEDTCHKCCLQACISVIAEGRVLAGTYKMQYETIKSHECSLCRGARSRQGILLAVNLVCLFLKADIIGAIW